MEKVEEEFPNFKLIKDTPVEGIVQLENTFKDTELINFIEDVTHKLYQHIKNDYIPYKDDEIPESKKISYAKHKMNVIIDICRDSGKIKKLSKIYNNINPKLYSRYMITLYSIYFDYIKILKEHKDYIHHKDKILNLYSGMQTIPVIKNSKILIKHPIDTTLRPNGYFVRSDDEYYLNFKVRLDGLIIPIIGSCFEKWADLGIRDYTTSEYEFLYIGTCDLDCENIGNVNTGFEFSYNIYSKMFYQNRYATLEDLLRKYIEEYDSLEAALTQIPILYETNNIDYLLIQLINEYLYNYLGIPYNIRRDEGTRLSMFKTLIDKLIIKLFINNIKNKFINSNERFKDFLYDLKYIFYILLNQINKKNEFNDFDFKLSISYIISLSDNYPHTIRELCKSKFLNQDILIDNEFRPKYIIIDTINCMTSDSLRETIRNECERKYLKYKKNIY